MAHRTTITIPEDLNAEVRGYLDRHANGLTLSKLIETALREYLTQRTLEAESVFTPTRRTLRITPVDSGSGLHDISISHDKYLAEDLAEWKPASRGKPDNAQDR